MSDVDFVTVMAGEPLVLAIMEPLLLAVIVPGLLLTAFWIWMLVDCIRNEPPGKTGRLIWIVFIAATHWIGATAYFFFRRRSRTAPADAPPPSPGTAPAAGPQPPPRTPSRDEPPPPPEAPPGDEPPPPSDTSPGEPASGS